MYYVLLDKNNFYTGVYSKIGKMTNGVEVETLPPEENQKSYKLVESTKIETKTVPLFEYRKDINTVSTLEDGTAIDTIETVVMTKQEAENDPLAYIYYVKDDKGNQVMTTIEVEATVKEWVLDDNDLNNKQLQYIEDLKISKNLYLNQKCTETINSGIDIETSIGVEHFSLTDVDQLNIKAIYDTVASGAATSALYHSDGNLCRLFSSEEITNLMMASIQFVTYNTTLCNHLHVQVSNLTTAEEIESIEFTEDSLSEEYKKNLYNILNIGG